jgi:ribonucleotide reductase alpha subunit
MTTIEHPYPEIGKVLVNYEEPFHKNDKYIIGDLNKIYEEIRKYIVNYIVNSVKLQIFNVNITNKETGEVVFKADVEFPITWSKSSVDVFASKYLIRNSENSICQAVSRIVAWITLNGFRDGHLYWDYRLFSEHNNPLDSKYVKLEKVEDTGGVMLSYFDIALTIMEFSEYLTDIIINQRGTFNSPVWFNVGNCPAPMSEHPQTSACFITKIEDNMGSIIGQNIVNQMIALGGSGSGCDMTPIRSRKEWIGKQLGRPSGPIGFTGMFDAVLQATRSAGRFRRAAGLVSLKQHHPDIIEYIRFKANEEKKGRILYKYMPEWDRDFASESQFSIFGTLRVQNINTAVRLTKEFWDCWKDDTSTFPLKDRNGVEIGRYNCKELIREIAQAQLECGDPGIQYDDNVNDCNPFLDMGLRFNSSNACQPSFATVLTPNGISTFNEINIGDTIWSGQQWTKITHKIHTGYKEVFAYTNDELECENLCFIGTNDHKIIQNGERIEVSTAKSIDIAHMPGVDRYAQQLTMKIDDVEKIGMFDVWEIAVDAPEHTYWTGGLLVSNCSELQYLDNSACNLASLRITAYYDLEKNTIDYDKLFKDIQIMLMAQDTMIDFSYYPTKEIAETSYKTRNLGFNYGDLGGLLYMMGLPYDSDEGRNTAACITAYFNVCALITSKDMAEELGSFKYFNIDKVADNLKLIIKKQYSKIEEYLTCELLESDMEDLSKLICTKYYNLLEDFKMRNATVTIFVPQGTVGLASGNMTSGIEPFISHSYDKDLVGGGNMKMGTIQSIHDIAKKHFNSNNGQWINKLLETALGTDGKDILSPDAHIEMMAAVQPFISLGISKTVNCPSNITVEQIIQLYKNAHDMGLKAVTIYVDGSKVLQPLKTTKTKREDCPDVTSLPVSVESAIIPLGVLVEEATRTLSNLDDPGSVLILGWTVEINGEKFYMKFGWHPDVLDMIWEVWAEQSFAGGTVDGMTKTIAVMISRKLQEGIKLGKYHDAKQEVIKTMSKMTFPPLGLVMWPKGQPPWFSDINSAMSIPNLLAQMIASIDRYPIDMGKKKSIVPESIKEGGHGLAGYVNRTLGAQVCRECGRMMVKHGSGSHCYMCTKCGASVGGCG